MKRLELRWWQLVKYLAYLAGAALPVINWLAWAILVVIVWLLVLLGLGARRLVNRTKVYQNQWLSTTIDK